MKNLSLQIDTINGTGSLSANQILTRMLFRSGYPVGSYNFFPSNIAGLPCSYKIRLNSKGYTAYDPKTDILISLNPKTLPKNFKHLREEGLLVTDQKNKFNISFKGPHYDLPFTKVISESKDVPIKIKPLLRNTVYVGLLAEWLKIEEEISTKTLSDFFQNHHKSSELLEINLKFFNKGKEIAQQNPLPISLEKNQIKKIKTSLSKNSILIDGNTSVALGSLFAGCQFLSWYPITPSSSIAETFEKFTNKYQQDKEGKKKFAIIQSEDEISALTQVIGASWAGLRAMTVTSGPGLSLMNEAAGLSYFSEIPAVLCNVQRGGPSTGLPTRTQQGDLLSSCFLSHGDTSHIVLMPGTVEECFSLSQKAFDLAEELQTLVILLSDLDLGMNLHQSSTFDYKERPLNRGKILTEKDLQNRDFSRYKDSDQDGISYRSLPGTKHPEESYLTRGSGHNEKAEYSEDSKDYSQKLNKLKRKWETAKKKVPEPILDWNAKNSLAFVTFGNNEKAIQEVRFLLEQESVSTNFMRVRSYPFPESVKSFLEKHSTLFIVEQNRDAQLKKLLSGEFPSEAPKLKSILQYDGQPFYCENIRQQFNQLMEHPLMEHPL